MALREDPGPQPSLMATWLADEAVFQRTAKGQRELVSESHRLTPAERSFFWPWSPGILTCVCSWISPRLISG